ncbi:CrfX protein [Atopomonas sediminilitoris]|uniref:CrfX protein n=1 Tax=Atopomonas sediminilitoris TaxID=2919919 RepID=UPI001F4E034D|nr:CrfX protein [Atopomonas sediminilitoris]MCJ8167821.1 CrfX protein [Atopomonas sediminilitoris]
MDPFESSLRELLGKDTESVEVEDRRLDRVLRKANRQSGFADLLEMLGHAIEALFIGFSRASTQMNTAREQKNRAEQASKE